ncbi:MAG: hypothetical protein CTY30_06270 [Methylocystis sp.]|nr:MAG: hypothetical protein CTY30_06270 [Methylocystis sp.]
MDRVTAIVAIQALFVKYRATQPSDAALLQALANGKLYELFVLADLVEELGNRGFTLSFVGKDLKFKASPGMIKTSDPHFEVRVSGSCTVVYRIFVDIEFNTLGQNIVGDADDSGRHEIDIVVTSASSRYPNHDEIALCVECKCVANFTKNIVKEVLGVRRELCFLSPKRDSILTMVGGTPPVQIPANPPSEFRLAHIDKKGTNYVHSPRAFGIELKHLEP